MNDDTTLRAILALILACLVVLVIQSFRSGGEGGQGPYRISIIKSRSEPWLMRVNTETGQVEQFMMRGDRRWVTLGDVPAGIDDFEDTGEEMDDSGIDGAALEEEAAPPPPQRAETPAPPAPPTPAPAVAAPALAEQADTQADLDALVHAIEPGNPREIRVWAAGLLGTYLPDAPADTMAALTGVLDDSDPRVVAAAARSLGRSAHPDARAALKALRDHPDADVRAALPGNL
jgi:hypothetical protein